MPLLLILLFALPAAALAANAPPTAVFIVAGQSNLLNWHAAAAAVPPDAIDATIPFWHISGAPPDRGPPLNASSGGKWITLGPQRQEPFVRYERDFFGPEIALARTLARDGSPVAVIKVGFFGTTLARDWHPTAATGNRLYARLRQEIDAALSSLNAGGRRYRIAGFFWMQGETDAIRSEDAAAYATNLRILVATVRRDLGAPDLPFILGRIGPRPSRSYEYQETVRGAQVEVATSTPGTAWIDTDDLPRDTDGIHLLAPGVLTLGERWAAAWRRAERSPREASDSGSPAGARKP